MTEWTICRWIWMHHLCSFIDSKVVEEPDYLQNDLWLWFDNSPVHSARDDCLWTMIFECNSRSKIFSCNYWCIDNAVEIIFNLIHFRLVEMNPKNVSELKLGIHKIIGSISKVMVLKMIRFLMKSMYLGA